MMTSSIIIVIVFLCTFHPTNVFSTLSVHPTFKTDSENNVSHLKDQIFKHGGQVGIFRKSLGLESRKGNDQKAELIKKGSSLPLVVCRYNIPRVDDRPYPVFPEALNSSICTHIIVNSATVRNSTLTPQNDEDVEFYDRLVKLKKNNQKVKILLSVESVNDDAGKDFVEMIVNPSCRQSFISTAVKKLNNHGFDGLEVNWKYPCFTGPSEQKQLFSQLFQEFRNYILTNKLNLLLTAAVAPRKDIIDLAYDIPELAKHVDFISLMSYDYHTFSWITPTTGPNSPLHRTKRDIAFLSTLNVEWSSNYWYQNGMPAKKIIVGIPAYGRSYTLVNEQDHEYYSLAKDIGLTGYNGIATYDEVCIFLNHKSAQIIFNNETQEPYVFAEKEWISFESVQSAKIKANWILTSGFGGVAVNNLNSDDPYNLCKIKVGKVISQNASFPITRTIFESLFGST